MNNLMKATRDELIDSIFAMQRQNQYLQKELAKSKALLEKAEGALEYVEGVAESQLEIYADKGGDAALCAEATHDLVVKKTKKVLAEIREGK